MKTYKKDLSPSQLEEYERGQRHLKYFLILIITLGTISTLGGVKLIKIMMGDPSFSFQFFVWILLHTVVFVLGALLGIVLIGCLVFVIGALVARWLGFTTK